MSEYVYQIVERSTGRVQGVYSRAYHDEFDFSSAEAARLSNVNDIYQDRVKYRIQKVRVTREVIDSDVD